MGGAPCVIIINEGQLAYAVVERAYDKFPQLEVGLLKAAINASCNSIQFAGIYNAVTGGYISHDITGAIIATHKRIINELLVAEKHHVQELANELTDDLFAASRRLYDDQDINFVPTDLGELRKLMEIGY